MLLRELSSCVRVGYGDVICILEVAARISSAFFQASKILRIGPGSCTAFMSLHYVAFFILWMPENAILRLLKRPKRGVYLTSESDTFDLVLSSFSVKRKACEQRTPFLRFCWKPETSRTVFIVSPKHGAPCGLGDENATKLISKRQKRYHTLNSLRYGDGGSCESKCSPLLLRFCESNFLLKSPHHYFAPSQFLRKQHFGPPPNV